jgi:general secretion pathway protein E
MAARFAPAVASIPYAFARAHGVLPLAEEQGVVVVLTRPDATVDGLAEIRRVLQRPVKTQAVDAARFAAELARAYNTGDATMA